MKQMIIHAGGLRMKSIDDFRSLEDPTKLSKDHFPIRHDLFFDLCQGALVPKGWKINWQQFCLHQDAKKRKDNAFALWGLESEGTEESRILGCRNSNTKDFSAQLGAGQHVTVCDNLLFSAEVVVGRKHTKNIKRDLPRLVTNAMGKVSDHFVNQERRTEAFKNTFMLRGDVNHVMMECMKANHIPPSQMMHWVKEWEEPAHEEFTDRSAWSLQNSFTEVAKRWSFGDMQRRTRGFTGVMDTMVKVDLIDTSLTEGVEDVEVITNRL